MNPSRDFFSLIEQISDILPAPASLVDSDDSEGEPPRKVRCVSFNPLPKPKHKEHTSMETVDNLSKASPASFLPKIKDVDMLSTRPVDNGTLGSVVLNPPTFSHVLRPLTEQQLAGFRLQPGPLTGQYLEKSYSDGDDEPNQSKENMDH
ncbi:mediator of RNA polymerase II transcription subunit 19-like isoform X2 [Drosophila pseudoobscura]|uniref:Mediator of RNA polymerase II transcription subunit 19 n=1 Tax=Drosophila pseudoobscura pseudoobscura TaxID=46245 RepID=A0A0R3P4F4_DROPS|nr:mediator of RNA polymerase II transcription subunit 19 isoform X2 [Drosophila pseudoobscura]